MEEACVVNERAATVAGFLDSLPISMWGVAELTPELHPAGREFPRAISLIKACPIRLESYDEPTLHDAWEETYHEMNQVLEWVRHFLEEQRIRHSVPRGQDAGRLVGNFSHKFAATRAGLGWIGKNTLLVTRKYGPRVRPATVLVDLDLPRGEPITESLCGDCRECVDACPHGCIKGVTWYPGIDRASMFDAFLCSFKRKESIPLIGRMSSCGMCMVACPKGRG